MVDGDCKSRAVIVGIVLYHLGKTEFCGVLTAHRHTDEALAVGRHEVYVCLCSKLSCTDKVAFVFSVIVVGNEDYSPGTEFVEGFVDSIVVKHLFLIFLSLINSKVMNSSLCPTPNPLPRGEGANGLSSQLH